MKQLKDYLHLYLGCEVMTPIGIGTFFKYDADFEWTWCEFGSMGSDFEESGSINSIKLILRPLSDITEDEKEKLSERPEDVFEAAEEIKYLLSKHFDLFGLIEAGLAIDKTTLK